MLGVIELMGIGLLGWYIFIAAMSFCVMMMGNSYLKNSGAVPKSYNPVPSAVIFSLIPLFNILFAIRTLRFGWQCWKDPKVSDKCRKTFDKVADSVKKTVEDLMEMSREDKDDNE